MNLLATNTEAFISNIKNPFNKEGVKKIRIEISKPYSFEAHKAADDGYLYEAQIQFEAGKTSAWHNLYGNSLEDLLRQIQAEMAALD